MASNSKNIAELLNNETTISTADIADGAVTQVKTDGVGKGRNLIINGAMLVAQRGDQSSMNTDGQNLTCDRFQYDKSGSIGTVYDVSQEDDAPDGFYKSLKLDVTTADTAASDEFERLEYRVEAQDVTFLNYGSSSAEQVTLSFWVKSNKTGTFGVTFYTQDTSRNIGSTYTINTADTWENKTITFAGDTGGSGINHDNGVGIQIDWLLQAGSNWTSSDNTSWATFSNARLAYGHAGTIGQSTSDYFQITGIKLEVGANATPFDHRTYAEELSLCQRYYQYVERTRGSGNGDDSGAGVRTFSHRIPEMRATPTTTFVTQGSPFNWSSESFTNVTKSHISGLVTVSASGYWYYNNGYTAEAEL